MKMTSCFPMPMEFSEASRCLKNKLELLKEFLAVTDSLKRELDLKNLAGISVLLERRQSLIEAIEQIEKQIGQVQSQGLNQGQEPADGFRNHFLTFSKEIETILLELKRLDEDCLTRLASWRWEVKDRLSGIQKGAKTVHRYSGNEVPPPKFMDAVG